MESVYQEYTQTVHYQNASGVRAICTDCHVPKTWPDKLIVKIRASLNELPKHYLGTIDTPQKFEANRERLAQNVWEAMRKTDSRACRHCHSYDAMGLAMQDRSASKKHSAEWRKRKKDTCIDCHQGIVHKLPQI
jgi:nitrate/TMAO reductase-like tetraheme cytochrome c subunit